MKATDSSDSAADSGWFSSIRALLGRDDFTDVTFVIGNEERVFKAHRLLLALRSPVLAKQLYAVRARCRLS